MPTGPTWFATTSTMTQIPLEWAVLTKDFNSSGDPKFELIPAQLAALL